jgi:hypothetical protein
MFEVGIGCSIQGRARYNSAEGFPKRINIC